MDLCVCGKAIWGSLKRAFPQATQAPQARRQEDSFGYSSRVDDDVANKNKMHFGYTKSAQSV